MKVSIIIPVKKINHYIHESIPYLLNLDYKDYEIIILPDEKEELDKVRIIPTGNIGPAEKRDIGAKHAKGSILCFLDDDSYPRKDWLKKMVRHFSNKNIAAVGGPAITPSNDNKKQKASGLVLSSFLGGGGMTYRYVPGKLRYVDDYPSVNLSVRKDVFDKINGFDTHYWPGEDTKLCLDIVNLGYKIIYDPDVLVYHHRRELFLPHLKQVVRYSIHRAFFCKKFPKTSLRAGYFIPTLFVLFLIFGAIFSFVVPYFNYPYISVISLYALGLLFTGVWNKSFLVMPGILFTHLTYGIGFIKGLLVRELKQ